MRLSNISYLPILIVLLGCVYTKAKPRLTDDTGVTREKLAPMLNNPELADLGSNNYENMTSDDDVTLSEEAPTQRIIDTIEDMQKPKKKYFIKQAAENANGRKSQQNDKYQTESLRAILKDYQQTMDQYDQKQKAEGGSLIDREDLKEKITLIKNNINKIAKELSKKSEEEEVNEEEENKEEENKEEENKEEVNEEEVNEEEVNEEEKNEEEENEQSRNFLEEKTNQFYSDDDLSEQHERSNTEKPDGTNPDVFFDTSDPKKLAVIIILPIAFCIVSIMTVTFGVTSMRSKSKKNYNGKKYDFLEPEDTLQV